ncbi:MAG: lipoyl(octanoyl) transferase [Flavobacteriales bacterium]|nr:lipoyl(octanoyl) transferase [Flavobacteriales bacterium]|tara:strand:- start:13772 stop:14455 length:684 start_codon:yes stop_codon:yes gene_type:complete
MNTVFFKNLGLVDFKEAWAFQEDLLNSIIVDKKKGVKTKNYLIFCQHPHVYTMGKSGNDKNILIGLDELNNKNASFYKINRGGDVTYHGPGQLVVYPIFDLDNFFTDIHKYMRFLEDVVIFVLEKYSIKGVRVKDSTGVWVEGKNGTNNKICAMGVRASRWVTMHGLAFNVDVDLGYFKNIIPCGISDKGVTSLCLELGGAVNFEEVIVHFKSGFKKVFNISIVNYK